jgi:Protein of unknown function (DUF3142)
MNAPHPWRIAIALGVVSGAVVIALSARLLHGPDRELGASNDLLCTQLNSSCLAMVTDAPQLRRLFILGVDVHWMGHANVVSINWQRLKDLRHRTVIAVRMQGQLNWVDQDAVLKSLQDVLRQARSAGVAIEGIYFDYRGARDSLKRYADFLGRFRSSWKDPKAYVITSIDASWLGADGLFAAMDESDEMILLADNVSMKQSKLLDGEQRSRSMWPSRLKALRSTWTVVTGWLVPQTTLHRRTSTPFVASTRLRCL